MPEDNFVKLYRAIAQNDMDGLNDAIFFLGQDIHEIYVWSDLTAIRYAARLGHGQQVEVLLRDLEKYGEIDVNVAEQLAVELVAHREQSAMKKLLCELLERISTVPSSCLWKYHGYSEAFLETFANERATDLLKGIVGRDPDRIEAIVRICFESGNADVFRALREELEDDPNFINIVQELYDENNLIHAIMIGDIEEFSRLLQEFIVRSAHFHTRKKRSSARSRDMGHTLSFKSVLHWKARYYEVVNSLKFVRVVVQSDDADIFRELIKCENVSALMQSVGRPEDVLLDAVLSISLESQSMKILELIISNDRFDQPPTSVIVFDERKFINITRENCTANWTLMYFTLLLDGKSKSAAAIKHLSDLYDENAADALLGTADIIGIILPKITCKAQATRELLEQVIVELQLYFTKFPEEIELCERLKETMREFSVRNYRPDLVEAFRDSDIDRVETEVAAANAERCDMLSRMRDDEWDSAGCTRNPDSFVSHERLHHEYLSECRELHQISSYCTLTTAGKVLLKKCITESGRMPAFSLTAVADLEYMLECESSRKKTMNLQKLCRQTIRGVVRTATLGTSFTEALLSLYVDKHLPRRLVSYLLYREDSSEQPLYYTLAGGDFSSRTLLYTNNTPVPERYSRYDDWEEYGYRRYGYGYDDEEDYDYYTDITW